MATWACKFEDGRTISGCQRCIVFSFPIGGESMALISKIVLSPLDSENYPGSVLTGHMNCRLQLCYIGTINGPKCKSHHSLVLRLPYTGSQMQGGNAMTVKVV